MYLPRLLESTLRLALESFPAVLVAGPRQSGKTTFLRTELGRETDYLSLDDPLERDFARRDPEGFLSRFRGERVILDEVQHVPEIFAYLKLRIDRERERKGRYVLTGSQQFGLMAGVTESLAGRIAILDLLPFSLLETASDPRTLESLLWTGSYPEPFLHPEHRDLWLRSYLATYVERDVRQLQHIQDLRAFETFLALVAAFQSQELNYAALARDVGISQPTVKSWIGVLEAGYLGFALPPYFENLGKRVVRSPKLYLLDAGLVSTLTRQPSAEAALAGAMGGALFEGWVVSEVLKLLASRGLPRHLYFWRTSDGLEVDLLIAVGGRLLPIEIKLTATPTERHLEPLTEFKRLAGQRAAAEGALVCRVTEARNLPNGNVALPWQEFPAWLASRLG